MVQLSATRNHILVLLLILFLSGCQQHPKEIEQSRHQTDSIYSAIKDINVLRHLEDSLRKENNVAELVYVEKSLGKQLRNNSFFIEALDHHKQGLIYATLVKDTVEMVRANNNIATDFRRMGILDDAASYHYAALMLCEKYSVKETFDSRKNRVTALNGLGNVYLTMKDLQTADSLFRMALKEEQNLNSDLGQAINYANIGAIFEQQGRNDSARAYYKKSMEHNQKAGSDLGISLCYIHFGELNEKSHQWDKAISEYKNAYHVMEHSGDQWHWLESIVALAKVNISKGDYVEADKFLKQAQSIADDIHSLEHQAMVAKQYYRIYEARGDYRKALQFYKTSEELEDSVVTPENMLNTQNYRVSYVNERHRNEMDAIMRTHRAEQNALWFAILAIALALILAITIIGFLFHSWRRRALRLKALREEFSKAMQEGKKPGTNLGEEDNDFINKLVNQIYEDMQKGDVSVEKLARNMFISRSQLSRKVLNLTGMNTSDFVLQVRMGKARRLLEDTMTPITEIAIKCGFSDPSYFTRMFKKTYDITPSQARKRSK